MICAALEIERENLNVGNGALLEKYFQQINDSIMWERNFGLLDS